MEGRSDGIFALSSLCCRTGMLKEIERGRREGVGGPIVLKWPHSELLVTGPCSGAAARPSATSAPKTRAHATILRSNVQGRFLRCHAPGVTPTISLNTRAKWLCSANPVARATSARELAPSLSMI